MIHLVTTYYLDKNDTRQHELNFSLEMNLSDKFDSVKILTQDEGSTYWAKYYVQRCNDRKNIYVININKRPTFQDIFKIMNENVDANNIQVTCNSDIFFTNESAKEVVRFFQENSQKRVGLALSRWDYSVGKIPSPFHGIDTQDTWAISQKVGMNKDFFENINFNMGIPGCDNRLAHELKEDGFELYNPCNRIKTYHFHDSQVRNALKDGRAIQTIPPPYHFVTPV